MQLNIDVSLVPCSGGDVLLSLSELSVGEDSNQMLSSF